MTPEFSIVIPTDQRPALLLKCLDALGQQDLPRDQFEIIVVDDGNSTDTETAVLLFAKQIARSGGPLAVRYLSQPERQGPAAARNRGWRAARGRFIAFTDVDCIPQPDWLSGALLAFRRGAQVVAGHLQPLLPDRPVDAERTRQLLPKSTFTTANCFCQKSVLEHVDGFEEIAEIAWREDGDLQFKLLQAGIPVVQCPEAVVAYPVRSYVLADTLGNKQKQSYNALLYKQYPALVRERLPRYRWLVFRYYAAVISIVAGFAGLLLGYTVVGATGLGIWTLLSLELIIRHLPGKTRNRTELKRAVVMALTTPFQSVYWRLYGALKYRVRYW